VSLLAGGSAGYVNLSGSSAKFRTPWGVAVDSAGTVYVADSANHSIRKVTAAGAASLLAGGAKAIGPEPGITDDIGANARFNSPSGVAVDTAGNVYVADTGNNAIRKITPGGSVSTLAGSPTDDPGFVDGTGANARFAAPYGIAVDAAGTIYVADTGNNAIRVVTQGGAVSTLAGGGMDNPGFADATGAEARFASPCGVAVGPTGIVYVADTANNAVRRVTSDGQVTTFAGQGPDTSGSQDGIGTAAQFNNPYGIAVDANSLVFVADSGNSVVRKIAPNGTVSTPAGLAGSSNYVNGTGTTARFNNPQGIGVGSAGTVYVGDSGNQRIRKILIASTTHTVSGSAGANGSISPVGDSVVHDGDFISYAITPAEGYHVADVLVDGVSAGSITSYDFVNVTANHTISASFALSEFTITPSAGAHGSITPTETQRIVPGGSATFTVSADSGYHIADVVVDGASVGPVAQYTFSDLAADHTIVASFAIDTFRVTPTWTGPGSVSPGTAQYVDRGSSLRMTMYPNARSYLVGTLVGTTSVGASATYDFTNVTTEQTLTAMFAPLPREGSTRYEQSDTRIGYVGSWATMKKWFHSAGSYIFAGKPGDKAVVRFHGTSIDWITNRDHTYGIASVTLDGGGAQDVDLYADDNTPRGVVWSASGLADTDHTLTISYTGRGNALANGLPQSTQSSYYVGVDAFDVVGTLIESRHTISASASANGTLTPSAVQTVVYGYDSAEFTAAPAVGYHIEDVQVDGASVGAVATYRFNNVTASHTINADFQANPTLQRYEQTDSRIGYVGDWVKMSRAYHSSGSYAYANAAGGRAVIHFRGMQATWVTAKDCTYGIATVRVDGGSPVDVDLYNAGGMAAQQRVWSSAMLSDAEHVVTIEWTGRKNARSGGTYVGVDALEISGTLLNSRVAVTPGVIGQGVVTPSPAQNVIVTCDSPLFTFAPEFGYRVQDVLLDGVSKGAVESYRVSQVSEASTLTAVFAQDPRFNKVEQTDSRIAYSGAWTTLARPFHSAGSYAFTNGAGSATVKFTGTAIRWITNTDGQYGIASVSLDGGAPVDVDVYSGITNVAQQGVWSARGLSDGEHTVTISWTGRKNAKSTNTYIGVDAIELVGEMLPAQ
jgi:hypothetical protein